MACSLASGGVGRGPGDRCARSALRGPVERGGPTGTHRIGDRPVQAPVVGGKFFVGVIADRDDEIGGRNDVLEVARACGAASAACGAGCRHRLRDAPRRRDECRPRPRAVSCAGSTPPPPIGCAPNSGCRQTPPVRRAAPSRARARSAIRGSTADRCGGGRLRNGPGARCRHPPTPRGDGRSGSMTSTPRFEVPRARRPRAAAGRRSPADPVTSRRAVAASFGSLCPAT